MRLNLLICVLICALGQALARDPNWRLVFSDEFNGNEVDSSKWNVVDQDGNYGNNEQQYYKPSQVSVHDGYLEIVADRVPTNGRDYASGWVDTKNKFSTTYGRYEYRVQMPGGGNGMWPAIWLLSQELCWPQGAEFDIIEYRGTHPNDANGYYHYGTCCGCGTSSAGQTKTISTSLAYGFHTYALEWYPDNITWYMDDQPYLSFNRANLAFNLKQFDPTPHYLIMNSAVGGGFAGTPDSTTKFPSSLYVDHVRVYQYGATCNGNTCSGHGCCDPNSFICVCNAGWSGSSCEQWTGSFDDKFISTNIQYTPATDVKVNGWGNGVTFYSDTNVNINNGLTLTLKSCSGGCAGMPYSSGAWNSAQYFSHGTFTFIAKGPSVPGTGFSLQAAGQNSAVMEQISFVLTGANRTFAQLVSWHSNFQCIQAIVPLGFDASADFHNYTFVYNPDTILYYIDSKLVKSTLVVIPNVTLAMGAYYTAQPAWYGGSFDYNGPSTTLVSEASWSVNPATAKCSTPIPPPQCIASPIGTGIGLTGDYFDGDSSSTFFVNYKLTRVDSTINFSWGQGSPASNVNSDYFAVRWTGQVQPRYSGLYTFYSISDDGVRLYVDGSLIIDAWIPESSPERTGAVNLIGGKLYDIVLEYFENTVDAQQILSWSSACQPKQVIPQSQLYPCISTPGAVGNGLTGQYYSDMNLNNLVHTEIDTNVNFDWGTGGPVALNGQVDQFSAQWTGWVVPRFSGAYTFYASSDDGSRLYVNNQLLVNQWTDKSGTEFSGTINLVQNQRYSIKFQYYEDFVYAHANMSWSNACQPKQIIPQSQLFAY